MIDLDTASRRAEILRKRELVELEQDRRPAGCKILKLTLKIDIGKNIGVFYVSLTRGVGSWVRV